jgi:phosphohistidine phosphatase
MKKLALIRHAKAEKDISKGDLNRPLKYTGILDARFMAERMKELKFIPELLLTSHSLRTKTTAEIFADFLSLPDPSILEEIYNAGISDLLKVINELPDKNDFIGIIGHNPGIAQLIDYLTSEIKEVHTSTIAIIEFEADSWQEITQDSGKITYYSSPKE